MKPNEIEVGALYTDGKGVVREVVHVGTRDGVPAEGLSRDFALVSGRDANGCEQREVLEMVYVTFVIRAHWCRLRVGTRVRVRMCSFRHWAKRREARA